MNTERPTSLRVPLLVASVALLLAGADDAHVGCSPTLTCSLRPQRFAPMPIVDAGPQTCDLNLRRCAATQISAGQRHTCALTDAGNVVCWGDDTQGQRGPTLDGNLRANPNYPSMGLGDAGAYYVSQYSRVVDGAKQVTAGSQHTCSLLDNGVVICWGRAVEGQVDGRSDRAIISDPVTVAITGATQIDAGAFHTCAIVPAGVVCWGSGKYGQCGRQQSDLALMPELVPNTQGAVEVASGVRHTCARMNTSEVLCWGELVDAAGVPTINPVATPVAGLSGVLQISAGGGHSCALTQDYTAVCWGRNGNGQLGDGSNHASATPVAVVGLASGVGQVAAGGGELDQQVFGHSCAVDKTSQVLCWGHDDKGQLGTGMGADSFIPQTVWLAMRDSRDSGDTLSNAERVDLGASHGCSVSARGTVFCWGDDTFLQLGPEVYVPDGSPPEEPGSGPPSLAMRVSRFGEMR